jgi:replicative DNA helicase
MKKFILYLLLCFIFYSCSTRNRLIGDYYYEKSNVISESYYLKLKKDSFIIKYVTLDSYPRCSGMWKLKKDTLYLKCNEEKEITQMLSKGYMNDRDYELKIVTKDSLKLLKRNIILKRQ